MKQLYLIWYEPDLLNEIGILEYNDENYKFYYTNFEKNDLQIFSKNGLFPGFEDLNKEYESDILFPNVSNRLPRTSRIDYDKIKVYYDIKDNDNEFNILEKTQGKVSTDHFLFVSQEKLNELKNK